MNFKQQFLQQVLKDFTNKPISGVNEETKKQLNSLADYLLAPTVNPKALGLTYATIKYWESKGYLILSLPKEADEWRKYSVLECLWFAMLKRVVDMGCSLEKIAPQLIFAYANYTTLNSSVSFNNPTQPVVMVVDGTRVTPVNNFLTHILITTISRSKATIQFTKQGCQFYFQKSDNRAALVNQAYEAIFTTGINLCISDIVFTYVLGLDSDTQKNLAIFSQGETQVINLLNKKEISEITIKQEGGKIYNLSSVEKITAENLYTSLNSFITGDYQDLHFKTNSNKTAVLTRTTKQHF